MKIFSGLILTLLILSGSGCASNPPATPAQQRLQINSMADGAMSNIYAQYPKSRNVVRTAAGYAVFDISGGKMLYGGMDHGEGVVVDNVTRKRTYMKMFELQPGFGFGISNSRLVFVFKTRAALKNFITSGWQFSTRMSAAAKNEDQGGAFDLGYAINPDTTVYQMTEKGALVGVSITGAKYWMNDELN
ncbi:lipid-binding SYLF domain-containing protein [Candidatus Methylospira mobilis]|nr:YSC84-related protein [Candidatus Methylospira mobilis]